MADDTCSVDDCERLVLARAMCSMHYTRWHRSVGPGFKKRQGATLESKRCSGCDTVKSIADFYAPGYSRCADCQRQTRRASYIAVNVPLPAVFCVECGEKYRPQRRTEITCSPHCADTRRRRFRRIESPVYRALRATVAVEIVDPAIVFERDDWICQICHKDIPKHAVWPDLMSATMDHIRPLVRGGEHSYANTQASHFRCNASKGATYDLEAS